MDVAEINEDGTAKEMRLGSYPKPRGRAPLKKFGEPGDWCSKTGKWLGVEPKKSPAKKRQKTAAAAAAAEKINFYSYINGETVFGINQTAEIISI